MPAVPKRTPEHADLDPSGLEDQYRRTTQAIARGDFRAAEVRKLVGHGGFSSTSLAWFDEQQQGSSAGNTTARILKSSR